MYAVYSYSPGQTQANILADIGLIITGTTDPSSLSALCDRDNTTIYSGWCVPDWTLHDASAGTNAKCYKSLLYGMTDDGTPSHYKYMVLDTNTDGYILQKTYETWDATGHSGTYLCAQSDQTVYAQRFNRTLGGRIDVSASIRHCAMYSAQSGVYGASVGGALASCGVFERTRMAPWDAPYSYPPFLFWLTYATAYCPRILNAAGSSDITAASAILTMSASVPSPATTMLPGTSKVLYHYLYPIHGANPTYGCYEADISSYSNFYQTTSSYGNPFDEISDGAINYVIWGGGSPSTNRWAVRKG